MDSINKLIFSLDARSFLNERFEKVKKEILLNLRTDIEIEEYLNELRSKYLIKPILLKDFKINPFNYAVFNISRFEDRFIFSLEVEIVGDLKLMVIKPSSYTTSINIKSQQLRDNILQISFSCPTTRIENLNSEVQNQKNIITKLINNINKETDIFNKWIESFLTNELESKVKYKRDFITEMKKIDILVL